MPGVPGSVLVPQITLLLDQVFGLFVLIGSVHLCGRGLQKAKCLVVKGGLCMFWVLVSVKRLLLILKIVNDLASCIL